MLICLDVRWVPRRRVSLLVYTVLDCYEAKALLAGSGLMPMTGRPLRYGWKDFGFSGASDSKCADLLNSVFGKSSDELFSSYSFNCCKIYLGYVRLTGRPNSRSFELVIVYLKFSWFEGENHTFSLYIRNGRLILFIQRRGKPLYKSFPYICPQLS